MAAAGERRLGPVAKRRAEFPACAVKLISAVKAPAEEPLFGNPSFVFAAISARCFQHNDSAGFHADVPALSFTAEPRNSAETSTAFQFSRKKVSEWSKEPGPTTAVAENDFVVQLGFCLDESEPPHHHLFAQVDFLAVQVDVKDGLIDIPDAGLFVRAERAFLNHPCHQGGFIRSETLPALAFAEPERRISLLSRNAGDGQVPDFLSEQLDSRRPLYDYVLFFAAFFHVPLALFPGVSVCFPLAFFRALRAVELIGFLGREYPGALAAHIVLKDDIL